MAATTAYQAGIESDDVQISHIVESVWGTTPASQFTAIRLMQESLSGAKTRQRPTENNPLSEMAASLTGREGASGAINFALSYGTFDSYIESVMGNDWMAATAIAGASGDITLTNVSSTSATLSSTTSNKFSALTVGMWIRLLGFTNAANNGFARVSAKASNTSLTLTTLAAAVTETPSGTAAQVRASTIVNAALFKSLSLQKQVGTSQWFRYAGAHVQGMTLGGQVGGYVTGAFTIGAQSEVKSTANWSTGAVIAAPTGTVHDTVPGFGGVFRNEVAIAAGVTGFGLNLTRQNASALYGMGSTAAQGMTRGTLEVTGTLEMFFRDFTYYDLFRAETLGRLSVITKDAAGNAYVITLLNAALMNPRITAGGPGQVVSAAFTLEGNPQTTGGTIQFDRLPAT